jgi:hypothetical protein
MVETASLINMIKRPTVKVFRRFLVKRRDGTTGLFEADWQDLTKYVKRWGTFRVSIDTPRFGDLRFDNAAIQVVNIDGTFNPNDNVDSFWSGYGDLQRSLVRIEAGFVHQTQSTGGIWTNTEFPSVTTMWQGIISGDIFMSSRSEITLPLRPVTQIFRDYQASDVTFGQAGGITSGAWFSYLRDHTDGSANLIFRPFIGDGTTTDWSIATGGVTYSQLDSNNSSYIQQLQSWTVVERLAQAENSFAYINREGKFLWQRKTATASVQFEFFGKGSSPSNLRTYGHTIKRIDSYGKRLTSFYSRVSVKFLEEDTTTSFVNTGLAFAVSGTNTAWNLGHRTYSIENFLLNTAGAQTVAGQVFNEVSSQTEEIEFTTTLITHLNIMDRVALTYDATDFVTGRSLWDLNDWADNTISAPNDLVWDSGRGDSIILDAVEFKLLSIAIDLDNLETSFIAKRI